jgi:nicotinate-nucleotide pyrophosphorylase
MTAAGASLLMATAERININYVTNVTGVITIRQVNVTAQTDTNYDGNNASAVLPVGGALQGTDVYASRAFDNKNVGMMTAAGASPLMATAEQTNINYVTNVTGVITIRQVNVTAQTDTKTTMVTMPQLFYRLEEHYKQMFMQV